jgi:hypothetical protein
MEHPKRDLILCLGQVLLYSSGLRVNCISFLNLLGSSTLIFLDRFKSSSEKKKL